jgi:hypothetical protein
VRRRRVWTHAPAWRLCRQPASTHTDRASSRRHIAASTYSLAKGAVLMSESTTPTGHWRPSASAGPRCVGRGMSLLQVERGNGHQARRQWIWGLHGRPSRVAQGRNRPGRACKSDFSERETCGYNWRCYGCRSALAKSGSHARAEGMLDCVKSKEPDPLMVQAHVERHRTHTCV